MAGGAWWGYSPWNGKDSDTTERLSDFTWLHSGNSNRGSETAWQDGMGREAGGRLETEGA